MKRVAIVSPYFPPSTLAGVHRARLMVRHLPEHGWEPVVFCVDERYHEEPLDQGLAGLLPRGLKVVKTAALRPAMMRRIGVGDLGLRGYGFLRRALHEFLGRDGADVVFITGSPFYPMLLARGIRRRFGVPVVLDFQDPWVSPSGADARVLSKRRLSHLLGVLLEPRALKAADHVVAVSERQLEELKLRYPWLASTPMTAIPIGGEPADFEAMRTAPGSPADFLIDPGAINFSYVGTYWDHAEPVFRALLRGVQRLAQVRPDLADRLRFNFVGTSGQPDGHGRYRLSELAKATNTSARVHEIPERIPYLRAIETMARSDVLLLLGSDEPHFTASKIYPAMLSGRPALAVYHRASSACEVLDRAGGARLIRFESGEDLERSTNAIAETIAELAEHPQSVRPVRMDVLGDYCADRIAGRFARVFDSLVASRGGRST